MVELAAFTLGFCTARAIFIGYPILRDYLKGWRLRRRIDRLSRMEDLKSNLRVDE